MNRLEIPQLENIESTVKQIKFGRIKVTDLVKEHLELAKKVNKDLNAFIFILDDEALEKAKQIQERIEAGEKVGKLAGIPFTAKDLYLVKDVKTTFGSKYMEDFVAPYTGTVIQKCLDEDAILIGKTNCDPWGFGGSGENSGFGPAKNPYDLERTPGGSSSGSAASLAAGVGFFSLGTDTGGSVRQPASMCGLYGYKPTYGRNSRYGIGVMGSSFDTPGFFTRHIEDIELLEGIMEGRDIKDATTHENRKQKIENRKQKIRIGILKEFFSDALNSEIKSVIESKIEEYKKAGHDIVEVSIPSVEYSLPVYYILVPAEISSNRARYDGVRFGPKVSENYEENLIQGRSQFLEDEVKRRIMVGTYVLSAGYADQFYKKASAVRTKIKNDFKKAFEKVDILIGPTSPSTAFKLGEKVDDPVQMYLSDIYTVTANIVGVPSINIPIGEDSKGLPIGMQVMAAWDRDDFLYAGTL
jgi:aspartyl-tRNA(Asn)/glutamyl-tRNA(Gln) amidotransferase subunit A